MTARDREAKPFRQLCAKGATLPFGDGKKPKGTGTIYAQRALAVSLFRCLAVSLSFGFRPFGERIILPQSGPRRGESSPLAFAPSGRQRSVGLFVFRPFGERSAVAPLVLPLAGRKADERSKKEGETQYLTPEGPKGAKGATLPFGDGKKPKGTGRKAARLCRKQYIAQRGNYALLFIGLKAFAVSLFRCLAVSLSRCLAVSLSRCFFLYPTSLSPRRGESQRGPLSSPKTARALWAYIALPFGDDARHSEPLRARRVTKKGTQRRQLCASRCVPQSGIASFGALYLALRGPKGPRCFFLYPTIYAQRALAVSLSRCPSGRSASLSLAVKGGPNEAQYMPKGLKAEGATLVGFAEPKGTKRRPLYRSPRRGESRLATLPKGAKEGAKAKGPSLSFGPLCAPSGRFARALWAFRPFGGTVMYVIYSETQYMPKAFRHKSQRGPKGATRCRLALRERRGKSNICPKGPRCSFLSLRRLWSVPFGDGKPFGHI